MDELLQVDWARVLTPKLSPAEMIVRGMAMYVGLCLLLRLVLKRQAGQVALSDLLVVALVAGVCRNPLVTDAYSLPDGLGVIAVVLACSYALDAACYHVPAVHRLFHPAPVLLIRDGAILYENLRRELITEGQLRSKLRLRGVGDPANVAEAWLEGNGAVSVIVKS